MVIIPCMGDSINKFELSKERDYKVVKANEIIQKARYELNITELKALAFIFSKIKPTDTELQEYTFSVKDFCLVCGYDYKSGGRYEHIKKTVKGLRDKSFWVVDHNGVEVTVGWLSKARVSKSSGKITVKLDEDMAQYVLGLFENYTQYSLLSTLPMKSAYSIRIYELLKSYAFTKRHTFMIDDLKSKLGATHYVNFKDFRRKVIEVAVKEINTYTDLSVTWEPETKGRKVVAINFEITQKEQWEAYKAYSLANDELNGQLTIDDVLKSMSEKSEIN